ncbi:MAG: hypothetical protein RLY77_1635, partial [Pseudomonadota bacterium]
MTSETPPPLMATPARPPMSERA